MATTHPRLAAEWSPGNEDSPECYKKTDIYRKLWICPECHQEYGAKIRDREEGVSACPYCRGLWVRKGVNDLTTTDPELAKEWSPNNSDTADLHQKILVIMLCGYVHAAKVNIVPKYKIVKLEMMRARIAMACMYGRDLTIL